jgi:cysteine desulfurase/selenocysteine lyase
MNWNDVRKDFPLLVSDPSLCYLDSSATAQKPCCVLDAMRKYYEESNANPLRGLYDLSQAATDAYEDSREAVRSFINAKSTKEIIFTRNASESLNLAAYCLTERLCPGDEIAITIMEHHSDLIPWQMAAKRSGALLRFIECDEEGLITDEAFDAAVGEKTKIVAMTQVSNVLGVRNDIKKFAEKAHKLGALFVCDGAQSVPHFRVDVQALGVDFLAFSGHKMCGPMGIGVLYGREKLLEEMPPFLTGGEMIEYVTREGATWAELPHKFEAGTVNAGGAVGLAAAIDYYNKIGRENIEAREQYLGNIAFEALKSVPHLNLLGPREASLHNGIFTFTIDGVHPHDISSILDTEKIAIRAGHHCAQPLGQYLDLPATARASLYFYNSAQEVDRFCAALARVREWAGFKD